LLTFWLVDWLREEVKATERIEPNYDLGEQEDVAREQKQ
jgi:hypothetical protein